MRLKNILIVVEDMERSKRFYRDVMGLQVVMDQGDNVILSEGLVLQEKKVWEKYIGSKSDIDTFGSELFFVENNLDLFLDKINEIEMDVHRVGEVKRNSFGKRTVHILDPDRHLIEIGER